MGKPVNEQNVMNDLKEKLESPLYSGHTPGRMIDQEHIDILKREVMEQIGMDMNTNRGYLADKQNTFNEIKNEIINDIDERLGGIISRRNERTAESRMLDRLKDEIMADIQAQQVYRDFYQKNPNPAGRYSLNEIMDNAQEKGYTREDLLQAINQVQNSGTLKGQFNEWINSQQGKAFKWGLLAGAAGIVLMPSISKSIRPLIKTVVGSGIEMSENVQETLARASEDLQDIFAEVQFERSKDLIDREISSSGHNGSGGVSYD